MGDEKRNYRNDGPAYPITHDSIGAGMTLLDYFAASALSGLLASNSTNGMPFKDIAQMSYALAREMLQELEE